MPRDELSDVTATQVSLFQLDNYGPWTVTPSPRPEPDLQALQARLYADLAQAIGSRSGYVFYTRFDNMIAVTNGIDRETHRVIQRMLANRFPVTVSVGLGHAETPVRALAEASDRLQSTGSAQDADRQEMLVGQTLPEAQRTDTDVWIAHFDVIDVTSKYTDRLDAYEAHLQVMDGTRTLARHLYEATESLSFFVGGDNVIAVCPDLSRASYEQAIEHVESEIGIEFQVGIGRGPTAVEAGTSAKQALEACRRDGTRIEGLPATAAGD